ncbi:MAG: hypothetical protein U0359_39815 [Byssovorax sp.]
MSANQSPRVCPKHFRIHEADESCAECADSRESRKDLSFWQFWGVVLRLFLPLILIVGGLALGFAGLTWAVTRVVPLDETGKIAIGLAFAVIVYLGQQSLALEGQRRVERRDLAKRVQLLVAQLATVAESSAAPVVKLADFQPIVKYLHGHSAPISKPLEILSK